MSSNNPTIPQATRRAPIQGRRQIVLLGVLALLMAISIGTLYLMNVARSATTGRQLEALLAERDQLEQTNEQLRVEIAELRSVPRLLARAEELGYTLAPRDDVEYLVVDGFNPDPGLTVAPIDEAEDSLPTYNETLVGWLRLQVDRLTGQFETFNNSEDPS